MSNRAPASSAKPANNTRQTLIALGVVLIVGGLMFALSRTHDGTQLHMPKWLISASAGGAASGGAIRQSDAPTYTAAERQSLDELIAKTSGPAPVHRRRHH
jgi:hypothetical protein